jgi:acetyltransferase-like isoleucine patch superfamily enzyme
MRESIKKIFSFIFLLFALPVYIYYRCEALLLGAGKSFQGISQFLSLFPGLSGAYLRRGFYSLALKKCSGDCHIGFGTIFSHPAAEIGKHVYIGANCTIGDVSLGDYVTIGSNVDIMNGAKQHYMNDLAIPIQEQGGEYPKVYIGEDSWIGNSATTLGNVGKKCIVGAGSVVVEDVEDLSIVAGNPARLIRKRT